MGCGASAPEGVQPAPGPARRAVTPPARSSARSSVERPSKQHAPRPASAPLEDGKTEVKLNEFGSVCEMGITMSYFKEFAAKVPAGWTTAQVVADIVRAHTRPWRCRYAEIVPRKHIVNAPKYFISHMWSMPFADLVSALTTHLREEDEGVGIWLDMMAINQHPYDGVNVALMADDVSHLSKVVGSTESTLFVMDNEGRVLTRIWCLFEVWHTVKVHDIQGLKVLAYGVSAPSLKAIMDQLNVDNAQATVEEDKTRILAEIEGDVGAEPLSRKIKDALVESARYEAQVVQSAGAFRKLSLMLRARGQYQQAVQPARQALEVGQAAVGVGHPDTLYLVMGLAEALREVGQYSDALPMFQEVLSGLERQHGGDTHPSVLTALNNTANCLSDMGVHSDALALYQRALAAREQVLGPDHLDTLSSCHNLGNCLMTVNKHSEALPLHQRVLESYKSQLGPSHPTTLIAVGSLAACYKSLSLWKEALALYELQLEAREGLLGPSHPSTISSCAALAHTLRSTGRVREALPLYLRVLEAQEASDPGGPDALSSRFSCAACLGDLGKEEQAVVLFRQAWEGSVERLGERNPATVRRGKALCTCLRQLGRDEEAAELEAGM